MPISIQQLIALPNLGPGSSGDAVRTLQQWLVERGLMTQAQMNTGPGTYGPQTKAAVAAWQAQSNINTQGNSGYFGPLSKGYLQSKIAPAPVPIAPISPPQPLPPAVAPLPPPTLAPPPATAVFKSTTAYKALPQDLKDLVDLGFSAFSGTEGQQRIFTDALVSAQALADPYAKTQLELARGEFESKIAFGQGDLERASEVITRTRDQISQDVSAGKEFLSLEQQAEISKETTKYSEDLLTIADQAAEKGLTFATGARSRVLFEERRGAQLQDVIQSSQRTYNFKIKELELKAARGDIGAQKQLTDLRAKSAFQLEQIGRFAEKVLGTANLPGTPGYVPVGGVLGDIEQERRKTILEAAKLGLP